MPYGVELFSSRHYVVNKYDSWGGAASWVWSACMHACLPACNAGQACLLAMIAGGWPDFS